MSRPSRSPFSATASQTGSLVARAAAVVLLVAAALAAQVPARFTLGDPRERVRDIQGPPQVIERLHSLGIERWSWGEASVTFDPVDGALTGWQDPRRQLRVTLRPELRTRDSTVRLGASLGEVARIAGTPWRLAPDPDGRSLTLAFGRSELRVDATSLRVTGWSRRDSTLRVAADDDAVVQGVVARNGDARPTPRPRAANPEVRTGTLTLLRTVVADATGDGRLSPREFADVTFRIRNLASSATPALPVRVIAAPGLSLLAGTPDTVWLAPLAGGDSTDVVLTIYSTGLAIDPALSVLVLATGRVARFDVRIPTLLTSKPRVASAAPPCDPWAPRPVADCETAEPVAPASVARNPDALAVIVGVERYQRLADARYAERDATLMRSFAVRTLGVPDDAAHLAMRVNGDASGNELRRLLGERGWLARRTTPNSDVLLYFAGHGSSGAQRTPFLLPADADATYVDETGLDLQALFDRLARLPARSITVVLDACFTGLSRSGRPLIPGTRAAVVSIEHPALLRRNMAVFVAARGAQLAGDLPAVGHGAFTWSVARGLAGGADPNGDRIITVAELSAFIEADVSAGSASLDRDQQPLTIARDTARAVARLAGSR